MSRRFICAILLLTALTLSAQALGWWWDTFYRRGWDDTDINDVDRYDTRLYCVGDSGLIVYSPNSGGSWNPLTSSISANLYCVSLVDGSHGYAGGAGVVAKTVNGLDWTQTSQPPNMTNVRGIDFPTQNTGWACGGSYIARTNDGGDTWTSQYFAGGYEFYDIAMYSSVFGLAVDTGGRVFRWNGSSWGQVLDVSPGLRSVCTYGVDYAWAVGDGGAIYATSNGGDDWSPQSSGVSTTLNGVSVILDGGNFHVYAVGQNGVGLHSPDGGATWNDLDNPFFYNPLSGVSPPLNADKIIAVGSLYTILGTTNGTAWNWVYRVGNRLEGVAGNGPYPAFVVAVGQYGLVTNSWTHGRTWGYGRSGVANNLTDIGHIVSDDFVACGTGGTVIKTTDNGASWTDVSGNLPNRNWYGIDVLDANTWFVCGANLGIYYTTNGGASWTQDSTGANFNFYSVAMRDLNNGWAAGETDGSFAIVYRKTAGAWTRFSTGLSSADCNMLGVDVQSDSKAWLVGEGGQVYYLYSDGTQWREVHGLADVDYQSVSFMNEDEGWVVGDDGYIYASTNGGVSYVFEDNGASDDGLDIYDVYFWEDAPDYGHGWAVGEINCRLLYDDFTPVELVDFTGRNTEEGVLLAWVLGGDFPAGFEVHRREKDSTDWTLLNDALLPPQSSRYLDRGAQTETVYEYRLTVIETSGVRNDFGPVEVRREDRADGRTALHDAYPNPSVLGENVTLILELATTQNVVLAVYDLAGRRVATLVEGELAAGRHAVVWSTDGVEPGVYHCRLTAVDGVFGTRLVVTR
ncbi:MAG TPA: YCF48-related protein [bacterium]|nr:YCF48-related protein [bacterium]